MTILFIITSFLLTLISSYFMLRFVKIQGFIDKPDESRKLHKVSIPRFGGIPFSIITLILSMFYIQFNPAYSWYIFGAFVIFLTGLMDDIYRISWKVKVFIQLFLGILIFSQFLPYLPALEFFNFSLTFSPIMFFIVFMFWFLGILNAVNLADGMDGLAGGSFFLISLSAAYIGWATNHPVFMNFYLILAFSLLGFLFYNGRPAKFFMGDTGSLFLGFNLVAMPLLYLTESSIKETLPMTQFVIISSYFIIDTLRVFYTRVKLKKNPLTPDQTHFHHQLLAITKSYNASLIIIYLINIIYFILAILSLYNPLTTSLLIFYLIVLIACIFNPYPQLYFLTCCKIILNSLKIFNKFIYLKQFKFKTAALRFFIFTYLLFHFVLILQLLSTEFDVIDWSILLGIIILGIALYKTRILRKRLLIFSLTACFYYALIMLTTYPLDAFYGNLMILFKLIILPILLILFTLFSFRYVTTFLLKFWVVEDLLMLALLIFVMCLNTFSVPKPPIFPSTTLMIELALVYVILRSVLVEKSTGQIRSVG